MRWAARSPTRDTNRNATHNARTGSPPVQASSRVPAERNAHTATTHARQEPRHHGRGATRTRTAGAHTAATRPAEAGMPCARCGACAAGRPSGCPAQGSRSVDLLAHSRRGTSRAACCVLARPGYPDTGQTFGRVTGAVRRSHALRSGDTRGRGLIVHAACTRCTLAIASTHSHALRRRATASHSRARKLTASTHSHALQRHTQAQHITHRVNAHRKRNAITQAQHVDACTRNTSNATTHACTRDTQHTRTE